MFPLSRGGAPPVKVQSNLTHTLYIKCVSKAIVTREGRSKIGTKKGRTAVAGGVATLVFLVCRPFLGTEGLWLCRELLPGLEVSGDQAAENHTSGILTDFFWGAT